MVSVDVKHHVYLHTLSPSLISLMVPVDVKHHVHLLTLSPSLISLMVSVDVKHHVYFSELTEPVWPSGKALGSLVSRGTSV